MVSSLIGVAVVLCFMLLATHALLYLSTSSRVHAVAVDAARVVSGAEARDARAVAVAEHNARGILGAQAEFRWESLGPDWVAVRVSVPGPRFVPANLANLTGLGRIERRVRLRVERFR